MITKRAEGRKRHADAVALQIGRSKGQAFNALVYAV